jgi:pimeloyl-ACP methyl ester carboxylesterase
MKSNETAVFRTPAGEAKNVLAYNEVLTLWPTPYEELDISSDFGVTHIIASGPKNAEPIILLHGQYSTATSWIHLIPALCCSFRVFAVDTIGEIGKSRPSFLPKSRQDYRNWLCDIFDQSEIKKANLVGYSYGGFLATNFAIANPERVTRLILLAPGIPNLGAFTSPWAYYGLPMMILPSRFTIRRFINGASTKGYSTHNPVHEQMIRGMINMRKVSFLRPQFTDEELNKIVIPTLLILGEYEIMYEPRKALERATQLIANLRTELIPEAGHMLISDQPEMVNQSMLNFLQDVNLEH